MTTHWQPTAPINRLRQRAATLATIRDFFAQREVMEVDTPAMSQATVTDIHLHTFQTTFVGPGYADGQQLYLMTSPEFHMKRLLAAGSGPIYQICKSFRNEESGRFHNPEFTMLEWYRPGFDHHALMDEMDDLLQQVLKFGQAERMTYQQAFVDVLGVCPLEGSMADLKVAAAGLGLADIAEPEQDRDTLLQLLFSVGVEPKIGQQTPAFVFDFPASQAALAKINPKDNRVAERFEVYFKGIELANGFHELSDGDEQLSRFEADNRKRLEMGLEPQPIDMYLVAALRAGFPDCAGVALGVDRLIMLSLGVDHIDQVSAFPISIA
ncbi:elongation factor P--(R)-beta-lysine ligase [Photobacterium sp. BZF1]|uniref:elongation factor P--(R)-beta-lysine ligase n=1 Tax=Photobacterium sp. BZF1 TaxID=1904457 RepID=UPI0016537FA5|nr:elongation factor P--(R)-beta-lysine ligase [Photobacterium sp. BZF1]MBC7001265.1 elongation factor P--(R)-beta-lysine ligase [Photobacterium sp. BZF1]